MPDPLHPIQVVVERTGLTAHVIRIWEKRYGAVTPQRTESNRRLYSDDEIARLKLLRRLSDSGHGIGHIARMPTESLLKLAENVPAADSPPNRPRGDTAGADTLLRRAVGAVENFDAVSLESALDAADVSLGVQGALQRVIGPLVQTIGGRWREGSMTAAQEHFATAVIGVFLTSAARPFAGSTTAPVLVVTTPSGQVHELGAIMVGAAAANLGWRVIYLGPSLPAGEIAGVAKQHGARAVALSIVYPEDDPLVEKELSRLHELMPETPIIAGGRAMPAYRRALDKIGARTAEDLNELGSLLDDLRHSPRSAPSSP